MDKEINLEVSIKTSQEISAVDHYDYDRIIFDLDTKIDQLSSQADNLDYIVSVASGVLCAALDILWVGDFNLERGRSIASDAVDDFVTKTAKLLGCEKDDVNSAVKFLEKKFPIPSDGNTPDFGGGLQHHLRDFAHHPTIVGLAFSLLTQFTYKSYGTKVDGTFCVVDVPEVSKAFIGEDVPTKILYGTITWFFHLVSDIAGSSSTAGKGGGTGIPGPILGLAKELAVLPPFSNMKVGDNSLSVFLSKLFNGTLLAKHDEAGKIIKDTALKFDLRGELGIGVELGRQAIPVVANECIVRAFYFIRRFMAELKVTSISTFADFGKITWSNVIPANNPTIARMLTIAAGVFTSVDICDAIVSQKYWVAVNYVGVGRFALAIGEDVSWCLKKRDVIKLKEMYENIKRNTYTVADQQIYERIGEDVDIEKFGLTEEQVEILYNVERLKTLYDIKQTKPILKNDSVQQLKREWISDWKHYMEVGFPGFVNNPDAELHWYSQSELVAKLQTMDCSGTWLKLVLLEAMLFEPYYPLATEKDKKGNDVPSTKYKSLHNILNGYKQGECDEYLEIVFASKFIQAGLIKRYRKCYKEVKTELSEVLKTALVSLSVMALITVIVVATAGAFAPSIAVALVGTKFAGLSGAALTSACLAYLGGGAIASLGAGMAGGTIAIVGGGAALGIGLGATAGGAVTAVSLSGKKNTILQSAKLLVSVREIFLNDEHDLLYSKTVHEQFVKHIADIEKGLVELNLKADVADKEEKKALKAQIKNAEESVHAMKIARKSMVKFMSAFEAGMNV